MEQLRTIADLRREPDFGWYDGDELNNWLITPFSVHRDSDHLTVSNHETAVSLMRKAEPEDGDDYRVIRCNHWAVGWVDYLIVRPGSGCANVIAEQMRRYESYPVLDEEDFSRREWEDYYKSWADYGAGDFIAALGKEFDWDDGLERVRDLVTDADRDHLRDFYESLLPSGEYCIHEGSGCSFRRCIEGAVKNCGRADLAKFVRRVRSKMTLEELLGLMM